MTEDLIRTFLSVCEHRNITAASQRLNATQSTVSHRIHLLEQELGFELFDRGRGRRSLEPTAAGERFVPLARQWLELYEGARELGCAPSRTSFVIGGTNAINNCTFSPLYQHLVESVPTLRLRLRTHHTWELYQMLSHHQIDLGLVMTELSYPDVVARPLFREPMYLVCHKSSPYHDQMPPAELPAELEVYQAWSPDYVAWHNRHWQPDSYLLHTGVGAEALFYLSVPGRWSIMPWSLIEALGSQQGLVGYTLAEDPPTRTYYKIWHRSPSMRARRTLPVVEREIDDYVEAICACSPARRL